LSCFVFSRLGQGAFIVNGSIDATGLVSGVRLLAEAGGRCTFLNPWVELLPASNESQAAAVAAVPKVICEGVAVAVTSAPGPGSDREKAAVGVVVVVEVEEEEETEEEGLGGWFQFET
jgi:hypothetical protein